MDLCNQTIYNHKGDWQIRKSRNNNSCYNTYHLLLSKKLKVTINIEANKTMESYLNHVILNSYITNKKGPDLEYC